MCYCSDKSVLVLTVGILYAHFIVLNPVDVLSERLVTTSYDMMKYASHSIRMATVQEAQNKANFKSIGLTGPQESSLTVNPTRTKDSCGKPHLKLFTHQIGSIFNNISSLRIFTLCK